MARATKICRVCGKEYEACHTCRKPTDGFRWQDVACSPECGAIYLKRILMSRGELQEELTYDTFEDDEDLMYQDDGSFDDIPEDEDIDIEM